MGGVGEQWGLTHHGVRVDLGQHVMGGKKGLLKKEEKKGKVISNMMGGIVKPGNWTKKGWVVKKDYLQENLIRS